MKWSGVSCHPKESQPLLFREEPHKALWSLLFNLYVDDLLNSLDGVAQHGSSAFADDLAYVARESHLVESAMKVILQWCSEDSMEVNWSKTRLVQILPRSSPKGCPEDPFGQRLKFTSSYKYLGVLLDMRLTLQEFTDQVQRELRAFLIGIPRIQIQLLSVKS